LTEQEVKTYKTSEVLKETGLSMRQLDYWCTKGYVWPSLNDSRGSGDPRAFSQEDVDRILKIKAYIDEGFTVKAAAHKAQRDMEDREGNG
jgi:DNA-binding transcriptional MerR regulator